MDGRPSLVGGGIVRLVAIGTRAGPKRAALLCSTVEGCWDCTALLRAPP